MPSIGDGSTKLSCTIEIHMIMKGFEQMNDYGKLQLKKKLMELANPESTHLVEPIVKANARGRPSRKLDTCTRQDPSQFEVHEVLHSLSYFESNLRQDHWMTMPETGHIIAPKYNVVPVLLSKQLCLTFLPLRFVPLPQSLHKIIMIGFVNGCHFIEMRNLRASLKTPQVDWYDAKITHLNHMENPQVINEALDGVVENAAAERDIGIVHRVLLLELFHDGPSDEMRFMLGLRSILFSRVEFCLITGLKFGAIPHTELYEDVSNGIHHMYFGGQDVVTFAELEARIEKGQC
ncbi:hypothetical protein Dsin_028731 [Dipteronia sinensis]|uniref:Uncharacterized protein n=1 Tax=Dipteronia sinensis TaxID=43782 RepID=A0AAD9ZRT6_9ROSI|nr:hypothetical protein Dsin_028731 [Dipteronia sinensis]